MFNVMNQVKQGLEALITALPPEACLSLIMFRGADAVSYTHLDVYKRQVL